MEEINSIIWMNFSISIFIKKFIKTINLILIIIGIQKTYISCSKSYTSDSIILFFQKLPNSFLIMFIKSLWKLITFNFNLWSENDILLVAVFSYFSIWLNFLIKHSICNFWCFTKFLIFYFLKFKRKWKCKEAKIFKILFRGLKWFHFQNKSSRKLWFNLMKILLDPWLR